VFHFSIHLMCPCVHTCMRALVPISIFICVPLIVWMLYACVHVYMCACVHVCMCACVHVCMCACVHVCNIHIATIQWSFFVLIQFWIEQDQQWVTFDHTLKVNNFENGLKATKWGVLEMSISMNIVTMSLSIN